MTHGFPPANSSLGNIEGLQNIPAKIYERVQAQGGEYLLFGLSIYKDPSAKKRHTGGYICNIYAIYD